MEGGRGREKGEKGRRSKKVLESRERWKEREEGM